MYFDTTKRLDKHRINHTRLDDKYIIDSCSCKKTKDLYEPIRNGVFMEHSCFCHKHPLHYPEQGGVIDCCDIESVYQKTSQAAEYDFTIDKGTTLDFDIVYKDSSKCPVNLTGYKATLIATYNTKTFTINARISDAFCGKINLYMSAFETSQIFTINSKYSENTEYSYYLNLISPSKNVYKILEGTITVNPMSGE